MKIKIIAAFILLVTITGLFLFYGSPTEYINNHPNSTHSATAGYESVPLAEQVGQLFAVGHWPSMPVASTTEAVRDLLLGSVIIMATPDDAIKIEHWTTSWQAVALSPLLISIDQEGGIVSRLKGAQYIQTAQPQITTTTQAYTVAEARSRDLQELGINTNYAPVLDQSTQADSFMYPRVFRDTSMIASLGDAMVRGYAANNVVAVPKHFPGHPDTSDDSHITLPTLDLTVAEYQAHTQQFAAIIATGNVQMLMTAHVGVPALDLQFPATVSPTIIADLRDRLGYEGVIITDDLAMQAISDRWGYAEAAVLALNAGADMIMLAAEPEYANDTVAAVIAAVEQGEISRERIYEAYSRVMVAKSSL